MGEWSEYFEDFPEENPINHMSFKNDLGERAQNFPWALSQLTKEELEEELRLREAFELEEFRRKQESDLGKVKRKPIITLEIDSEIRNIPIVKFDACPICYTENLEIRHLIDKTYYCWCSECKITGTGNDLQVIMDELSEAIWNSTDG